MERAVVIANPVASQFTGGSHRDVMAEVANAYEVDAVWPGSAPEATVAAVNAAESGAEIVVAMGGDGMVHHTAQGLIDSDTALGIVPAGTTNVVARIFGIPARAAKAARLIASKPKPRPIGTVRLTLKRGETQTIHHALFAAGVGLDAEVVRAADADPYRKYRFGSLHYARTAIGVGLKEFPSVKPHIDFRAGDHQKIGTSALLQFRGVYTYFGRRSLRFEDDKPDPMSALIMGRLKRRRVPRIAFNALTHRSLGQIEGFEVWPDIESLDFDADPPVSVQADGESLGQVDGGQAEWAPGSLGLVTGEPLSLSD